MNWIHLYDGVHYLIAELQSRNLNPFALHAELQFALNVALNPTKVKHVNRRMMQSIIVGQKNTVMLQIVQCVVQESQKFKTKVATIWLVQSAATNGVGFVVKNSKRTTLIHGTYLGVVVCNSSMEWLDADRFLWFC